MTRKSEKPDCDMATVIKDRHIFFNTIFGETGQAYNLSKSVSGANVCQKKKCPEAGVVNPTYITLFFKVNGGK